MFAHGSGSGRFSPRNQYVAGELNKEGMATLLMDLLTNKEEAIDDVTAEYRFNIPLLAKRLDKTTTWIKRKKLSIGYFGSSTGAAAALIAASKRKDIKAIVSRGGRPDLALDVLSKVLAPTLLIVGGYDGQVIDMNKTALARLPNAKMEIIQGASHLFEEKGKLEEVALLAKKWLGKYLKQ